MALNTGCPNIKKTHAAFKKQSSKKKFNNGWKENISTEPSIVPVVFLKNGSAFPKGPIKDSDVEVRFVTRPSSIRSLFRNGQ